MDYHDIAALNRRASELGYEVVAEEPIGHPFNMGQGPWCRVLRDGQPCSRVSWRAEEVSTWLAFREREHIDEAAA